MITQPSIRPQPRSAWERAATFSWRFLLVVAALVVLGLILSRLEVIVVPLVVALLIAVAVTPAAGLLERRGLGHTLAAALVYLVVIAGVAILVIVFTPRFLAQFAHLGTALRESTNGLRDWLVSGPLHLSSRRADGLFHTLRGQLNAQGLLRSGLVGGATMAFKILAGAVIALILSFFFVKDGPQLWRWVLRMTPEQHREDVDAVGVRAVRVLGSYLWGSAAQGAIEATIIGVALVVLGTPLVVPLVLLQFAGAFFPLVGAVAAGGVAVLVTLVSGGFTRALILLVVVILVHQLEGNVLAPLVLGRAVRLHAVVVLVVLTAGGILGGVVGAFVAVPVTAVVWGVLKELVQRDVVEPPGDVGPLLDEPDNEAPLAVDEKPDVPTHDEAGGDRGRPAA